jgi:hypothetical protein
VSALDDLSIELDAGPSSNWVFIRNKNQTQWAVASVDVTGSSNFELWRITRTGSRPFLPQPFEIRIPAGQRAYVGRDRFKRVLAVAPDGTLKADLISIDTKITGGKYIADEHILLPQPSEAENTLFMYESDLVATGEKLVWFVNLSHVFGLTFDIIEVARRKSWSASFNPFFQSYWYHGPQGAHFAFQSATFFAVNPAIEAKSEIETVVDLHK